MAAHSEQGHDRASRYVALPRLGGDDRRSSEQAHRANRADVWGPRAMSGGERADRDIEGVDRQVAQRLVERYLLPDDTHVESVSRRPDGLVVQSDVAPLGWVIAPAPWPLEGF